MTVSQLRRTVSVFPFLIGTVRTKHTNSIAKDSEAVSIPHRYGKNSVRCKSILPRILFPFLIGTVRTWNWDLLYEEYWKFPFLIGTVRTNKYLSMNISLKEVSIPHRYGKNLKAIKKKQRNRKVSIPHRYGKNVARLLADCS